MLNKTDHDRLDRAEASPDRGGESQMLIPPKRRQHLTGLLELLSRGIVSAEDADSFVGLLRGALGVHGIGLVQNASYDAWNAAPGIPASWIVKHKQHEKEDPSSEILANRPPGTFYLVSRDLSPAELDSPLHSAFIDCGLRDAALTKLHNPFFEDLFLVLYRHDGQAQFTEDDRLLLTLLHPHLTGALATRRALGAVRSPDSTGQLQAYARLSWPKKEVEWSERGRRLWTDRLGPLSAQMWRRIDRAVLRAAALFVSSRGGGRSQLIVPELRVEFAYVPPRRGESRAMLAMFQIDAEAPRELPRTPAGELLTPRELAIARGVAAGQSLADVADQLGISRETARTYLKAVYSKFRVSGRLALARALGSSI